MPISSSSGSLTSDNDDDPVSFDSSEKSGIGSSSSSSSSSGASSPATSLTSSSADLLEPVVAAVVSGSKLKSAANSGGGSSSSSSGSISNIPSDIGDSGIGEVKIKPGRELKLKCELNNTYGRIIWLLNGQSIRTDNGRYSIQGPSVNHAIEGRLTINNVLPEDNGIWQCHETKFDGKEHISKPTRVIVLGKCHSYIKQLSPSDVHTYYLLLV